MSDAPLWIGQKQLLRSTPYGLLSIVLVQLGRRCRADRIIAECSSNIDGIPYELQTLETLPKREAIHDNLATEATLMSALS